MIEIILSFTLTFITAFCFFSWGHKAGYSEAEKDALHLVVKRLEKESIINELENQNES